MSEKIISLKRFIAGAKCPTCQQIDKTVTYVIERTLNLLDQEQSTEQDEIMACVSCGYQQAKSALSLNPAAEIKTVTVQRKIDIKTFDPKV
jgi:uncharacterized metal-binding protein (TIGR02443 family)